MLSVFPKRIDEEVTSFGHTDAGSGVEIGTDPNRDYSGAVATATLPACHPKHIFNFEPVSDFNEGQARY